ncbi:MAG: DM13 domain-containing protein [Acidiferrobacterales bacterium]|nr:DM13 domain-containing protein [Acidiferrobacterales bacterium]
MVKLNGGKYLKLTDNFKAKEGTDVKNFLSPLSVDQLDGKNASTDSIFIALMTQFKGEALIEIPAEVNLSDYQSLMFREAYSKLWGVAAWQ